MSKRSRPQPISAPDPESFLPTFDFGAAPKPMSSAPLPPTRKPVVSLSKRLAAFTFLNLEDIAEEMDDHSVVHRSSPIDRISPPPSTTSTKSMRFWEFNRSKHQQQITPASLPPMNSKAYATLIGGSTTGTSVKSSKSSFPTPPSKVMRQVVASPVKSSQQPTPASQKSLQEENPKSLAIDLVSIFSVSPSDDAETSPYSNTRFSFPMPPSSIPRRGSQSPLDPEMSMSSYHATSPSIGSMTSPSSDYSFFSPLFSPGFTHQKSSSSDAEPEYVTPISPLEKPKPKPTKKRQSIRPLTSLPPAAPPPRESPPPTPSSPTMSAPKRACPSPELDPELSQVESSASSIISVLMGGSNNSSLSLSLSTGGDESDAESVVSVLGPMQSEPQGQHQPPRPRKESTVDPVDVWANWGFGAPSRSGSIVTLTQRTYNSGMRGSISTASGGNGPMMAATRNGSVGLGSPTGRNGSFGSSDAYGDWDQAIDDLFSFSAISRKPSLASIAYAATAEGAALASTSMNVVENTAFVMDDEMMQKFMESKFLVPSRKPPTPPKQAHATLHGSETEAEASRSSVSLDQTTSSVTPSASATSSARSSLDEEHSTHSHLDMPLTPVLELEEHGIPIRSVAPLSLSKGTRTRPAPIIASQSYPPVNPTSRPPRPPRYSRNGNGTMLSAAQTPELPAISPLDLTHRPPPAQSVPSESSSLFSPSSLSSLSLSPQSAQSISPQAAFTTALDIDSWPTWSSIDVTFERKRDWRRPSAGAMTMMSKFSDDTVEVRPKKQRRDGGGISKTIKKAAQATAAQSKGQNMNPGSSYTSYTFLGLKKKKESSPPRKATTTLPRESVDSARSAASTVDGSVSRRDGLKRPPLPLELFIRA